MDTYSFLREFADSWALLVMFIAFVGIVFWVFRPSAKSQMQDTANIPFRHEDKPLTDEETRS